MCCAGDVPHPQPLQSGPCRMCFARSNTTDGNYLLTARILQMLFSPPLSISTHHLTYIRVPLVTICHLNQRQCGSVCSFQSTATFHAEMLLLLLLFIFTLPLISSLVVDCPLLCLYVMWLNKLLLSVLMTLLP